MVEVTTEQVTMDDINRNREFQGMEHDRACAAGATYREVTSHKHKVFIKGNPLIGAYVWRKWQQRASDRAFSYVTVGPALVQVWRFERRPNGLCSITHVYNITRPNYIKSKGMYTERVLAKDVQLSARSAQAEATKKETDDGEVQD